MKVLLATLVLAALGFQLFASSAKSSAIGAPRSAEHIPVNKIKLTATKWKAPADVKPEYAMFACGCFWGVEYAFRHTAGVIGTAVGYSGGHTKNPSYEQVCRHDTGHAETVLVEFDPKTISYHNLTEKFFSFHDPTTLNRQGPDVGDQYRSAIFYLSDAQKEEAAKIKQALSDSGRYRNPIVTEISPASEFYRAEEYHQNYGEKTPGFYCPIGGGK